jgi:hypothetical protein
MLRRFPSRYFPHCEPALPCRQRLTYLAGDATPSAIAAAAELSGDRGLTDKLKTVVGKAASWAAGTGTMLAKDAAKQAIHGALDAFNSGATWKDSLQVLYQKVLGVETSFGLVSKLRLCGGKSGKIGLRKRQHGWLPWSIRG